VFEVVNVTRYWKKRALSEAHTEPLGVAYGPDQLPEKLVLLVPALVSKVRLVPGGVAVDHEIDVTLILRLDAPRSRIGEV
jgi:hypothetical protein